MHDVHLYESNEYRSKNELEHSNGGRSYGKS